MNKPTDGARILVAEDEPKIARLLTDYLNQDGFETQWVSDGDKVMPEFQSQGADLVLLDIMMPGTDGMQNCKALRAISDVPIVMITARVEEVDRLLGLNLGADDYICKPFSPREVVARVKGILRRVGRTERDNDSGPFNIDEQRMQVSLDQQLLALTASEYKILTTMITHPGVIYSRDQLLDIVGDEPGEVSDRSVDSHIKNLRKKIAQVRPGGKVIASVYGVGYKLEDLDD